MDRLSHLFTTASHDTAYIVAISIALVLITLAPTIVGAIRRHPDLRMIFILNILFFWTWTVWLAVLVWAITGAKSEALRRRIAAWRNRKN